MLGNPSDGYGGKALACSVRNFAARVSIEPADRTRIVTDAESIEFDGLRDVANLRQPIKGTHLARLVHGAIRRFADRVDLGCALIASISEQVCSLPWPRAW